MAKRTSTTDAILVHADVSLSLTLLLRDLIHRANRLVERDQFVVSIVGRPGLRRLVHDDVTLLLARPGAAPDYLVVPPLAPGADPFVARRGEARVIDGAHREGAVVCSACLGALVVA